MSPKIYVAGHRGMVGSAIHRRLEAGGYDNLVTRTRAELDLPSLMMLLAESKAPSTENIESVDEDQASMDG